MKVIPFDEKTNPELFHLLNTSGRYEENLEGEPVDFSGSLKVLKAKAFEGTVFFAIHSEKIQIYYQKDEVPSPILIAEAELVADVETSPSNWVSETFSFDSANLSKVDRHYKAVIVKDLPGLSVTNAVFGIDFFWQFRNFKQSFYLDVPGYNVRLRWRVRVLQNAIGTADKKGLRYSTDDYKGNVTFSGQLSDPEAGWVRFQWTFEEDGYLCPEVDLDTPLRFPLERFKNQLGLFVDPGIWYDGWDTWYDIYCDGFVLRFHRTSNTHLITIYDPDAVGTTAWGYIGTRFEVGSIEYKLSQDSSQYEKLPESWGSNRFSVKITGSYETSSQVGYTNEEWSGITMYIYPDRIAFYLNFNVLDTFNLSSTYEGPGFYILSNTAVLTNEASRYESSGSESTPSADGDFPNAEYIATISDEINIIGFITHENAIGTASKMQYIDDPGVELRLGWKAETGDDFDEGQSTLAGLIVFDSADRVDGMRYDSNIERLALSDEVNDLTFATPIVGKHQNDLGLSVRNRGSNGFAIDDALHIQPNWERLYRQEWSSSRENINVILEWPFLSGPDRHNHLTAYIKCNQLYNTQYLRDEVTGNVNSLFKLVNHNYPLSTLAGTGQKDWTDPVEVPVSIGEGSNILILCFAYKDSPTNDISQIYFEGDTPSVQFTELDTYQATGNGCISIYYITSSSQYWPSTIGDHTVDVVFGGTSFSEGMVLGMLSYKNVDPDNPIIDNARASNGATIEPLSASLTLDTQDEFLNGLSFCIVNSQSAPDMAGYWGMTSRGGHGYNGCYLSMGSTGLYNKDEPGCNDVQYGSMICFSLRGVESLPITPTFAQGAYGNSMEFALNSFSAIKFNPNGILDTLYGTILLNYVANVSAYGLEIERYGLLYSINTDLDVSWRMRLLDSSGNFYFFQANASVQFPWAYGPWSKGLDGTFMAAWSIDPDATRGWISAGDSDQMSRITDEAVATEDPQGETYLLGEPYEKEYEFLLPVSEIRIYDEMVRHNGAFFVGNGKVEPAIARKEIMFYWDCASTTSAWLSSYGTQLASTTMSVSGSPTFSNTKYITSDYSILLNAASEYYYKDSLSIDFEQSAGLTVAFWFAYPKYTPELQEPLGLVKIYGDASNYIDIWADDYFDERIWCDTVLGGTSDVCTQWGGTYTTGHWNYFKIEFDWANDTYRITQNEITYTNLNAELLGDWGSTVNITEIQIGNFLANIPGVDCYLDQVFICNGVNIPEIPTALGKPIWCPKFKKDGVVQQMGVGYELGWTQDFRPIITAGPVTGS